MKDIQYIKVSSQGAELTSVVTGGREYLWQGDPQYWGRHAPILFPIVGRLVNDTMRIDGAEYQMKQHGFARDAEFVQLSDEPVVMRMQRQPIANYPYDFDLSVRYSVYGNTVEVNWEVKSCGDKNMYFQIGAHPAFMLPDYNPDSVIHGYFRCYNQQGQTVLPITSSYLDRGLRVVTERKEVVNKKGLIPITNNTFAKDAILLEGGNIGSVGLVDIGGNEILRVECQQADVFGLWAPNKPGCPFVCIEPWCGVADRQGFSGDVSERDCIHVLAPQESFCFHYSIKINQ